MLVKMFLSIRLTITYTHSSCSAWGVTGHFLPISDPYHAADIILLDKDEVFIPTAAGIIPFVKDEVFRPTAAGIILFVKDEAFRPTGFIVILK